MLPPVLPNGQFTPEEETDTMLNDYGILDWSMDKASLADFIAYIKGAHNVCDTKGQIVVFEKDKVLNQIMIFRQSFLMYQEDGKVASSETAIEDAEKALDKAEEIVRNLDDAKILEILANLPVDAKGFAKKSVQCLFNTNVFTTYCGYKYGHGLFLEPVLVRGDYCTHYKKTKFPAFYIAFSENAGKKCKNSFLDEI